MTDQERIDQLRSEIRRHDRLYYVDAKPEISDRDYDRLMDDLKALEAKHPELVTPDSPSQRVGGEPIEGFSTVRHALPMLSIDNTYNEEQVRDFDARIRRSLGDRPFHYLVDPKIDGLAISLRYEHGMYKLAATRGDGETGDDVTANVRTIKSVPLSLVGKNVPDVVEARGEVYWPRKAFAACNAARKAQGQPTFANPRNGAAGTLKQLDPKIVSQRGLAFFAHSLGEMSSLPSGSAYETMKTLADWGLPMNPHTRRCKNIDEVLAAIHDWLTRRNEVDYETDGMVVKVDDFDLRDELGQTSKYPRWCIAYKYEAQRAETIVREIECNVGRLGTVTPVAHFDPVHLSGTTVTNASLHNFDQVALLDVRVGDTVLVEKAGEIIPQVVQVVFDKRPAEAHAFNPPRHCPACGKDLFRDEGGVYLRCVNPECPPQIRRGLEHFCGRDQMDIEGFGPALLDELIKGKVRHFGDLYRLTVDDLVGQELSRHTRADGKEVIAKIQPGLAEKLVTAVQASKTRGLDRLLTGLGIRHVGGRAAEVLAAHFGDIDRIAAAGEQELSEVHEIGPVIARSVHDFFHSDGGRDVVARLKAVGVQTTAAAHATGQAQPLKNRSVVVTGTLEHFTRSGAEEAIKAAGGRVTSSVSKNTDFVVVGVSPGSKADKARTLGVEIIDEAEFVRRLEQK